MGINVDEIILRLEAQGAEAAAARIRNVAGQVTSLDKAGTAAATGGAGNIAMTLGGMAMAAQAAIGSVGIVAGMLATLSGVRVAAQFEDLALALETVTGSADKASKLLKELKRMGAETPFDTTELASFASQLIAAGTAAEQVVGQLRTLADLAAYSRVPRTELPRFLQNMMQMRGQPVPQMQDLKEMIRLAPAIGKIVAAGTGANGPMTSIEAMKKLQTMSGQQAFDTILRGTSAIAKDAAIMAATLSPINMFGNLIENLGMIMEPTGHIILAALKPVMALVSDVASRLGALNELTRGFLGLGILIALLVKSWGLLRASMIAAKTHVDELVASIQRLAVASSTAAGTAAVGSGAQTAAGAAGALGLAAKLRGWLGNALGSALKFARSGLGIGLGLQAAGYGASFLPGKTGKYLSNILSGAGMGVMFGMPFGPWGIGIGAALGGILGGVQTWLGDRSGRGGSADTTAAKLDTTNRILKDIRGHMIGGGGRSQSALAGAEIEIALARRFAMGYG